MVNLWLISCTRSIFKKLYANWIFLPLRERTYIFCHNKIHHKSSMCFRLFITQPMIIFKLQIQSLWAGVPGAFHLNNNKFSSIVCPPIDSHTKFNTIIIIFDNFAYPSRQWKAWHGLFLQDQSLNSYMPINSHTNTIIIIFDNFAYPSRQWKAW